MAPNKKQGAGAASDPLMAKIEAERAQLREAQEQLAEGQKKLAEGLAKLETMMGQAKLAEQRSAIDRAIDRANQPKALRSADEILAEQRSAIDRANEQLFERNLAERAERCKVPLGEEERQELKAREAAARRPGQSPPPVEMMRLGELRVRAKLE